MKKSLFISILLVITIGLFINPDVKAFDNSLGKGGRCTGSSYCTACSNCSRCAHCSSGGSCGVCDRRSSKSISNTPTKSRKSRTKKSNHTNSQNKSLTKHTDKNTKDTLIIFKNFVNIRKEASVSSIIIEKVYKDTRLIKLQKLKSWYKIKVEKTGTVGYLYSEDLK